MPEWYSKVDFQTGWMSKKKINYRGMIFRVEANTRLEAEKKVLGIIDREYRGGRIEIKILEQIDHGRREKKEEHQES